MIDKLKKFWQTLDLKQKIALGFLLSFLILGPILVLLSAKTPQIAQLIPGTLLPISPKPSPINCITGITRFGVNEYCGNSSFRYLNFTCEDGFASREGGKTSCKSIQVWLNYALATCKKHPRCTPQPTPTPKPTSTPRPTPTIWPTSKPTQIPTVTPRPTVFPTPIPKPSPTPIL